VKPFPRSFRASPLLFLIAAASSHAIGTGAITSSVLSPDCLAYRAVGVCFWLHCSIYECEVRTSVKIEHYVPDAVVSSYSNTGENPWIDVAGLSPPSTSAQAGGDGTTNHDHENNLAKFKNADVIGHPAGVFFNRFVSESGGYTCEGAGLPFMPYLLSTLDTIAWRYNIPEMVFPESLTPGLREIGSRQSVNLWGSVYPRGGFLHQVDDHKSGAVVAQRAGDVVTRRGQVHVYQPLIAQERAGYWPAGPLIEGDPTTGKWQELVPTLSNTCSTFPHSRRRVQAADGGYVWALWRPYSCCRREGQLFLGHIDLSN
jgi:integrating conjugative element protein (TIGR03756 family)